MNNTLDRKGGNTMSASRLTTYNQCPKKYWFTYFSPVERVPPNIHLLFGTHIHKALEYNDQAFIRNGKFEHNATIENVFIDNFTKEASKTPGILKEDIDKYLGIGEGLIKEYIDTMPKDFFPISTEHEFRFNLSTVPVELYGFVDCVSCDREKGEEESAMIIERKTSGRSYNENTILEKRNQLLAYVIWYRNTYKKKEKCVMVEVLVKTKTPKVQRFRINFEDHEIAEFLHNMFIAQKNIKEGVFTPTYQNCSWCDFRGHCRQIIPSNDLSFMQKECLKNHWKFSKST